MRGYDPRRVLQARRARRSLAAVAEHGRRSYFLNVVRIALAAGTIELRAGQRLRGEKRRAIRRLARLGSRREPVGWLAARALRPLAGRNETVGIELSILSALAWRHLSRIGVAR
jgi:hypothetical protein